MKFVLSLASILFSLNASATTKTFVFCQSSRVGASFAAGLLNKELDESKFAVHSHDDQGGGDVLHYIKSITSVSAPSISYIPKESLMDGEKFVACVTITGVFEDIKNPNSR